MASSLVYGFVISHQQPRWQLQYGANPWPLHNITYDVGWLLPIPARPNPKAPRCKSLQKHVDPRSTERILTPHEAGRIWGDDFCGRSSHPDYESKSVNSVTASAWSAVYFADADILLETFVVAGKTKDQGMKAA
eukprot:scaffold15382_cov188-Skeletonema_marinoi.AAC.2